MLIKTHLAICVFFVLIFLPIVNHDFVFVVSALITTFIPDIDSRYSKLGRRKLARILQFFVKHRGVIHSFSFLFLITLIIAIFFPVLAVGFFLGYGLHLFADSFTIQGIKPFWPLKKDSMGSLRTGGKIEKIILWVFVIADVLIIVGMFS